MTKGYDSFKQALEAAASPDVTSFLCSRADELQTVILGTPRLKIDLTTITTVGIENFSVKLAHGLAVIESSYNCLLDCASYLENPPSASDPARSMRYVYLHIEQYLNESATLQERLIEYLKTIPKLYRRDPWYQSLLEISATLTARVTNTFDSILKNRDDYREETRYRDERLDLVLAFEAYPVKKSPAFIHEYQKDFQQLYAEWRQRVQHDNHQIRDLLDICFAQLHTTLFDDGNNLIYPKRLEGCG